MVSGWSEIDADARPFILSGAPAVAFAGNHSLSPTDPYDGPVVYARSGTGAAWSLGSDALTQSVTGTGDDGIGAGQVAAGDPVTVYSAGGSRHLAVHHGIGPGVPAATADVSTPSLGETQFINVARDAKSGLCMPRATRVWATPPRAFTRSRSTRTSAPRHWLRRGRCTPWPGRSLRTCRASLSRPRAEPSVGFGRRMPRVTARPAHWCCGTFRRTVRSCCTGRERTCRT